MDMLCVWETNRKGNNGIVPNEDGPILRNGDDEYMQGNESIVNYE